MLLVGSWIFFGGRAQQRLCPEVLTIYFCFINFLSNLGRFSQNAEALLLLEMCCGWAAFQVKLRNLKVLFLSHEGIYREESAVEVLTGPPGCEIHEKTPGEFEKLGLKSQLPINACEKRNQSWAPARVIQPSTSPGSAVGTEKPPGTSLRSLDSTKGWTKANDTKQEISGRGLFDGFGLEVKPIQEQFLF